MCCLFVILKVIDGEFGETKYILKPHFPFLLKKAIIHTLKQATYIWSYIGQGFRGSHLIPSQFLYPPTQNRRSNFKGKNTFSNLKYVSFIVFLKRF